MTQTAGAQRESKPFAKVTATKRDLELHVAAIKRDLAQWLDETGRSAEGTPTTIAVLETAFDRYLAERTPTTSDLTSAAADVLDLIQPILRRAVQRRRVTLRINASRMTSTPVIPINDEELANRLTEMLKLLDAAAKPLPKDAALRQFINEAAEPLGTLLSYFVGGIDGSVSTPAPEDPPPAPDPKPPIEPYPIEFW